MMMMKMMIRMILRIQIMWRMKTMMIYMPYFQFQVLE